MKLTAGTIRYLSVFGFLPLLGLLYGCKSPAEFRRQADDVAYKIIEDKQIEALGRTEPFSIERPGEILRKRLLMLQNLPVSADASLGAGQVDLIEHWPEKGYPYADGLPAAASDVDPNQPVQISLLDALQIGAANSFTYQSQKEDIFASALSLDLERNEFRNFFTGQFDSSYTDDQRTGERTIETNGLFDVSRQFANGAQVSAGIAAGLVNLLTLGGSSSLGLTTDASVSVPLLRGSGAYIVTYPLTLAERDVIYAIWDFERFKREFAVKVASDYLDVLRQQDQVVNSRENYISAMTAARQSRRLADAGRLPEIQVDQAVQQELSARARWISAVEGYKRQLDSFKTSLGLPPDAYIELDRADLDRLETFKDYFMQSYPVQADYSETEDFPSADVQIEPIPPSHEDARPLELPEDIAISLAFENRRDLQAAKGRIYDAQREVIFRADRLRGELTLFGSAVYTGEDNGEVEFDKGVYTALLTLDLPLERTTERNAYRNSYIAMEQTVRQFQQLEDSIKLSVRNELRNLLESREQVKIQAMAVTLAEKRERSTKMFLDAGRAEIRDLLEAQDALLSAQNQLTTSIINYRIAELNIQRDMGVLQVDETGLWKEFSPEDTNYGIP